MQSASVMTNPEWHSNADAFRPVQPGAKQRKRRRPPLYILCTSNHHQLNNFMPLAICAANMQWCSVK